LIGDCDEGLFAKVEHFFSSRRLWSHLDIKTDPLPFLEGLQSWWGKTLRFHSILTNFWKELSTCNKLFTLTYLHTLSKSLTNRSNASAR